jgi:hypothetical protein
MFKCSLRIEKGKNFGRVGSKYLQLLIYIYIYIYIAYELEFISINTGKLYGRIINESKIRIFGVGIQPVSTLVFLL